VGVATDRDRLLRLLDSSLPAAPARVLVFGPDAPAVADALRARGYEAAAGSVRDDDPRLADGAVPADESLDAIVAAGLIENLPWDRWALQQMHRWTVPGGRLVVTAANLWDLRALFDPAAVAGRLAKQGRKVARALGRPVAAPAGRPRPRAYDAAAFRLLLEDLGFAVERLLGGGPGAEHVAIARRIPSVFGLDPARPFPDPAAHVARFERDQAELVRIRDAWIAAHPDAVDRRPPREFVPAGHAGSRVLVLAPHPDDEIIGCGGTVGLLVRAGAQVTVLQATDGSASASFVDQPEAVRRRARLDEAAAVARAAGFARTVEWREDNRAFVHRPELVARMRALLEDVRPQLVFVPFFSDIHPDHVLVARLLAEALEGVDLPGLRIFGTEIWSRTPTNAWCDVTAIMPAFVEWLMLYPWAMKVDDFVHACAARGYANSLAFAGRPGFVEAFHESDAAGFRAIAARRALTKA
jgi:LmbE family N-acetylglucosaminyl deacetylase